MKPKDHVIKATDLLAEVASILIRIDYANGMQTRRNVRAAGEVLADAIEQLGAADDATADDDYVEPRLNERGDLIGGKKDW